MYGKFNVKNIFGKQVSFTMKYDGSESDLIDSIMEYIKVTDKDLITLVPHNLGKSKIHTDTDVLYDRKPVILPDINNCKFILETDNTTQTLSIKRFNIPDNYEEFEYIIDEQLSFKHLSRVSPITEISLDYTYKFNIKCIPMLPSKSARKI